MNRYPVEQGHLGSGMYLTDAIRILPGVTNCSTDLTNSFPQRHRIIRQRPDEPRSHNHRPLKDSAGSAKRRSPSNMPIALGTWSGTPISSGSMRQVEKHYSPVLPNLPSCFLPFRQKVKQTSA